METPVIPEANLQDPDVGLFQPEDLDTDTTRLSAASEDMLSLVGRLIGRSGDLRELLTGAAAEFSDLVNDSIQDGGQYNDTKWREASMAMLYCSTVADAWAEDVSTFRRDRGDLIEDFNRRLRELRLNAARDGGEGEDTPSHSDDVAADWRTVSEEQSQSPLQSSTAALLSEFNQRAKNLIDKARDTAEDRAHMLEHGPTAPHVRKLVDGGHMGWGAYNILGAEDNPPLPLTEDEATQMAQELKPYLNGEKEPDERYYEILAALSALNSKAVLLQEEVSTQGPSDQEFYQGQQEHPLRAKEIRFYQEFFAELDDGGTNVVQLMGQMNRNDDLDWSDDQLDEFARTVGNGLLVLSNEDLGGGVSYLPPSVQDLTEGRTADTQVSSTGLEAPSLEGGNDAVDPAHVSLKWLDDASALGDLLEPTDPEIVGGEEFSAGVTTSTGHHLSTMDPDVNTLDHKPEEWHDSLAALVEVSTRNDDANHQILNDDYNHPLHGNESEVFGQLDSPDFQDNGDALEGLHTFDWNDDGRAAAGLTSWISDAAESDDPDDQLRATEATAGLLEMTTVGSDRYDAYRNTGYTVDGSPNASMGLLNPHVARSFQEVMEANAHDFGRVEGDKGNQVNAKEDFLESSYRSRKRFIEYIMADEDSAARTFNLLSGIDSEVPAVMNEGEDGAEDLIEHADLETLAQHNGTLRALMDSAIRGESLNRTQNSHEKELSEDDAEEKLEDRALAFLSNLASEGADYLPASKVSGLIIDAGFEEIGMRKEQEEASVNYEGHILEDQEGDANSPYAPNDYGLTYTKKDSEHKLRVDLLDLKVRNGEININEVDKVDGYLVNEDGKSVATYYDHSSTLVQEYGLAKTASDALDLADPKPGEPKNSTLIDNYSGDYHDAYKETMGELFPDISITDDEETSQKD